MPLGVAGRIQVTEAIYQSLCDRFEFERRGEIEVKGKGLRAAYLLIRRRPEASIGRLASR